MDVAPWCYKWTGLDGTPGGVRPPSVPILIRTSGIVKVTAKLDWLGGVMRYRPYGIEGCRLVAV